tara:strand:- start:177 stop:599 length:423 start_codon:yes stop_codon:yes gene_type:complete
MKKTSLIIALTILALNVNAQITYRLTSSEILKGIEDDDTKPFLKAVTVKYIIRKVGNNSIFIFKDTNGKTVYKVKAKNVGLAQESIEGTEDMDSSQLMHSKYQGSFMVDYVDSKFKIVFYLENNLAVDEYEYKLSFLYQH